MTEKKNEFNELLEDLKGIVKDAIDDEWTIACRNEDFDSSEETEAYGDTYVSTGRYITEQSEEQFRNRFVEDNTPGDFIDKLRLNNDFCSCIESLIKEVAKNRELEV